MDSVQVFQEIDSISEMVRTSLMAKLVDVDLYFREKEKAFSSVMSSVLRFLCPIVDSDHAFLFESGAVSMDCLFCRAGILFSSSSMCIANCCVGICTLWMLQMTPLNTTFIPLANLSKTSSTHF